MGTRAVLAARVAVLVVLVGAMLAAACLEDLPPPSSCPPTAKTFAGNCGTAVENALSAGMVQPPDFCLPPQVTECFNAATTCACDPAACPADPAACYPHDECPALVTQRFGSGVTCLRVAGTAMQPGPCGCGCPLCANVCDGVGPVIGTAFPDAGTTPPTGFPFAATAPLSGTLGFYVRARGFPAGQPMALAPIPAGSPGPVPSPYPFPLSADFDETILLPASAYSWQPGGNPPPPAAVAVLPLPGVTLAEIDCIIPFVVAR